MTTDKKQVLLDHPSIQLNELKKFIFVKQKKTGECDERL